jgi:hypothetical protein
MNELKDKLEAVLATGINDATLATVRKQVDNICDDLAGDVLGKLKEELAYWLSDWVGEMATKVVKAILDGDEDAMRGYLGCKEGSFYTGRTTGYCSNPSTLHQVSGDGTLFEHGALALRKKIVDAYRDLLVDQRILDLEDQVKSLVGQVNRLTYKNCQLKQDARDRASRFAPGGYSDD